MRCQNKTLAALLLLGAVLLGGCRAVQTDLAVEANNTVDADAVWVAYWGQTDAEAQLAALGVTKLCLFGAYFDENGNLLVAENTKTLAAQLRASGRYTLYLTAVNDKISQTGENSLKDTALLTALLGTEEAAAAHVSALLDTVQSYGLDGVEIDYERLRRDYDLWAAFTRFLELLIPEAAARGLAVRVVLEPSTPIEDLALPQGAEYVVMCYNLYGSGTEPGPKADRDFLLSVKQRFSSLPDVGYALANGGFQWAGDGSVTSLTTAEAAALAAQNGQTPSRSEENGALTFTCRQDGTEYTVWYGDGDTLTFWADILNEGETTPHPISVWRLNG